MACMCGLSTVYNTRTIKDAYPIPRIDDNLDALSGSMWFTSLDLDMAYQCLGHRKDSICNTERKFISVYSYAVWIVQYASPVSEGSGMGQRNREPKNNDCGTHNSFSWSFE